VAAAEQGLSDHIVDLEAGEQRILAPKSHPATSPK
jgi:hypothetical protein